jgi:hypothetical protein
MVRLKAAMVVDMDEITELVVGIQTDMAGGKGSGNGSGNGKGSGSGNMSAIDLIVKDMMVTDHRFTNGATNVASSGASSVASNVASSSSSGLLPSGLLPSSSSRPEAKENVVARTARRSMIRRSSSAGVHGKAKLLGT